MPHAAICARLSEPVKLDGGRIVFEYPETQMVELMFPELTAGFRAPGVHEGSGNGSAAVPRRWQLAGTAEL